MQDSKRNSGGRCRFWECRAARVVVEGRRWKVGEEEGRGKACPHAGGCGLGLRPGRMSPVAGGLGEMNGASPPLARAAARATQCLPLSLNLPIARPPAVRRPISKKVTSDRVQFTRVTYPIPRQRCDSPLVKPIAVDRPHEATRDGGRSGRGLRHLRPRCAVRGVEPSDVLARAIGERCERGVHHSAYSAGRVRLRLRLRSRKGDQLKHSKSKSKSEETV
jgi:hypothetical protein